MTQKIQSAKVICKGGLDVNKNYLQLNDDKPGAASQLLNFEPSIYGGYQRILGFSPLYNNGEIVDSENAEGPILGIAIFNDIIIVARKQKNSDTYKHYVFTGGTWVASSTITLSSIGVRKIRFTCFNFDGVEKIIFVDGVNNAVIFDGINWIEITTSGDGSSPTSAGGDQYLKGARYVCLFANHIFLSGFQNYKHLVIHSAPQDPYNWTVSANSGQIIAGFQVTQIYPYRDSNYVFGRTQLKKIVVNTSTFVIQDVATNIGCIAPDTIQEINSDLIFLAQDGFRNVSSTDKIGDTDLASISGPIRPLILDMYSSVDYENISSVVVASKSQIRFFFSDSKSVNEVSRGIIGAVKLDTTGVSWEWAELRGIRASCACSAYINSSEYIVHGDFNGGVYRQEIGKTFNGKNIPAVYQTPYLDFSDNQTRKTIRNINLSVKSNSNLTIDVGASYNYSDPLTIAPNSYQMESNSTAVYYGKAIYNTGAKYSKPSGSFLSSGIQGSGYSVQMTFTTFGDEEPYSIQGLIFELSVDGRD